MFFDLQKMAACGLAAGVMCLGLASAQAADSERVAELKKLAADMKPFSVRAVGLPTAASEWGFLEKPFWSQTVGDLSGGKVKVTVNNLTELNLKGPEVFRLTAQGTFDIADIVANYGAGDLPQLDGMDLAGVAQSFDDEKKVLAAYAPIFQKSLKDRFGLITLGQAHSTPQVFFCRGGVKSVEDLKGKKVRLTSSTLANVVTGLGATPVTMDIGEAVPAMQRGVLDCIITGTMSGNTAKLYEVGDSMFTLVVGWAPRLRIVNGKFWAGLDDTQRKWLQLASDYYFNEVSDPTEQRNANEGIWCTTGDSRCTLAGQFGVVKAGMKLGEPSDKDLAALRDAVSKNVLPAYAKACGEECTTAWNASIGKVMNYEAKP